MSQGVIIKLDRYNLFFAWHFLLFITWSDVFYFTINPIHLIELVGIREI
jgi:hypothetical protein